MSKKSQPIIQFPELGLKKPQDNMTAFVSLWIEAPDGPKEPSWTLWGRDLNHSLHLIADFPEEKELMCLFCAAHLSYTLGVGLENAPNGLNIAPLNAAVFMANNKTGSIQ